MNNPVISFLLVLLIEAICAVVNYLKERLMERMCYRDSSRSFASQAERA